MHQRPLESRQRSLQDDKTRTREFRSGLEIHQAERFAQIEMLLRLERIFALGAEAVMLDIVVRVGAVGNIVERQVWNFRKRGIERRNGQPLCFLRCVDLRLQSRDLRHQRGGAGLVLLGLGLADLFGGGIAPGERGFKLGDRGAALFIEREELVGLRRMAAPAEGAVEFLRMLANPPYVVHAKAPRRCRRPATSPETIYSAGLVWAAAGPAVAAAFFSTIRTAQIEPS